MITLIRYNSFRFSEYFNTNLPEHWLEKRLGYLAKQEANAFVDGPFGSDLKTSDYQDDGVPLIQLNNIRDGKHLLQNMKFISEQKKQQLIRHRAVPGDIVIAKMADPVARSAIVASNFPEYVIVADCVKMTPDLDLVDFSYLVWAINCDYVRINAELVSTGTTRIRINLGELQKLKIPFPPKEEQKVIASFLDHETAKIDTLIEKQQQLIKLLKEKRQAVISHAVTKGLNLNAPMRDSGVEWLGEVPAHWKVMQIRRILFSIEQGKSPECESRPAEINEWGVLKTSCVNQGIYSSGENKRLPGNMQPFSQFEVKAGDVLMSRASGSVDLIGSVAYVYETRPKILLSDKIFRLHLSPKVNKLFFTYLMQSSYMRTNIQAAISGAEGMANNITKGAVMGFGFALPPISEQIEIIDLIAQKLDSFNTLVKKSEAVIELLKERRTALISAAVTGKIDVRNWQAPSQTTNQKIAA